MPESTLKPCPFCGRTDNLTCSVLEGLHCIECDSCDITGPRRNGYLDAINAWNIRPVT